MNDATFPIVATAQSRADGSGSTSRAYTMEAPQPGTYWRLRVDLAERYDNQVSADAMSKDTVLMLAEIEHADGLPHAYNFAPHPSTEDRDFLVFHADVFYSFWEPAPDGEAVRAAELDRLMVAMEETKRLMLAPPPDSVPAGLLTHSPGPTGDPGTALTTRGQVTDMLAFAARLQEDAEIRSKWIALHSEALGEHGMALARFHQERAQAGLAKANAQLEGVKGLLKTAANLKLYVGEGVDVMQLRDGEPAPRDERLTVFQEVLSLDEECLINLDDGGLDHTQVDALVDALADPRLLQRLIPAQRGMVLCKFRNSYKEFAAGNSAAAAHMNSHMNAEAQQVLLLVRDGRRLLLVDIPDVVSGLKQLMPSTAEQDAYFTERRFGQEGRRITRDDIAYADAQRKQIGMLDRYGQVLIALWGLHDRTGLFDGSSIPRFSNWLDPAFQSAYMALVSQDNMLGVERPSFAAWRRTQNSYLASGAMVAVDLGQCFREQHIPGAFASQGNTYRGKTTYTQVYKPSIPGAERATLIARVRSDKAGLYVEVPLVYDGYNRNVSRQRTVGKLFVQRTDRYGTRTTDGVLVLDRARSADLDYYLTSRKERRGYQEYVKLFRVARTWTADRDRAEQPLRGRLRAAVTEAGLAHDADLLDGQITDSLAVARTARRDAAVPTEGTAGFKAFLEGALAALHTMLVGQSARIDLAEKWAKETGRLPLRLAMTGKDVWKLYAEPAPGEHDIRLGRPTHAVACALTFNSDGTVSGSLLGRELLRAKSSEHVIHDWEREVRVPEDESSHIRFRHGDTTEQIGAAGWLQRHPTFTTPYSAAIELIDLAREYPQDWADSLDLGQVVDRARAHMYEFSRGSVERLWIKVPIGSGIYDGAPVLLLATHDALELAYALGDKAVKRAAMRVVEDIYANPQSSMKNLREAEMLWGLSAARIDAAYRHRHQLQALTEGWRLGEDSCTPNGQAPSDQSRATMQVMTISALGAKLIPWLPDKARAALT